MPAKIVPGRNALRNISGRRAGEERARTQGPLRGEDFLSQSANAGQSPSVASLAFGEASSGYAGLKQYTENDRPLTDNVAFSSDQWVFVLKRPAALMDPVSPYFRLHRTAVSMIRPSRRSAG